MDRIQFRNNLDQIASKFDQHSKLVSEAMQELQDRIEDFQIEPTCILDIGCRTGSFISKLSSKQTDATLIGTDESKNMITAANQKCTHSESVFIVADLDALPFGTNSVDLIVSNLSASFYEPRDFLNECHRVLDFGGVLMFSMVGLGSFEELKMKHRFFDMHSIGDLMNASGFANSVVDIEKYHMEFDDCEGLYLELKNSGMLLALTGQNEVLPDQIFPQKLQQQTKPQISAELIFGLTWKKDLMSSSTNVPFVHL